MRSIAIEIYKTLNDLNPLFMKEIFCLSKYKTHRPDNLFINSRRTSKYGDKSLRILGAHIWNSLPKEIKNSKSIFEFKGLIKNWFGLTCICNLCKY